MTPPLCPSCGHTFIGGTRWINRYCPTHKELQRVARHTAPTTLRRSLSEDDETYRARVHASIAAHEGNYYMAEVSPPEDMFGACLDDAVDAAAQSLANFVGSPWRFPSTRHREGCSCPSAVDARREAAENAEAEEADEIEAFKIDVDAALAEAQRLGSAGPIWTVLDVTANERVVNFGDVARAVSAARAIEKGPTS